MSKSKKKNPILRGTAMAGASVLSLVCADPASAADTTPRFDVAAGQAAPGSATQCIRTTSLAEFQGIAKESAQSKGNAPYITGFSVRNGETFVSFIEDAHEKLATDVIAAMDPCKCW